MQEQEKRDIGSNPREEREETYRKITKWMWRLTIVGLIGLIGIFVVLSFTDLPTFEQLENPKSNLASEIYAGNGEVLGRYYIEKRIPVPYDSLSPYLVQAFISTEDERYYSHSGIDLEGLGRVLFKTILLRQKSAGGASTITQQLAKNLFTDKPGSGMERVIQKLKEWIIAVKLERSYTKEEIMSMYLNQFDFINDAYGIKAASETYFGKGQDDLNVEEAAVLIGMLKNPSLYNPRRFPEKVEHRRMVVLKQMQKNGVLSQTEYDSLRQLPLDMSNFNRGTHNDGPAPYFRSRMGEELKRILAKKQYAKQDGSSYDIYRDGLKIYTTLDPTTQRHAEAAMREHMAELQKKFWKVWNKRDPWTFRDPSKEKEELDLEAEVKERTLKKHIRSTDRYASLREKHLGEQVDAVKQELDINLRDVDIERMLSEEGKKGSLAKLVSRKLIGNSLAVKYRRLMGTNRWKGIKTNWENLQSEVEKSFSEPVKMKVFAYNDKMEKDTTMSPLDSIKYHRMFLQIGSMAVDPITGHVKAWVGGINHRYFKYDHVTTPRQVGSTFKPFVYATAIAQQGISPCFEVMDLPYTIHANEGNFHLKEDWTPQNANEEYSAKPYTLFKGLQYSKNTVSVFLMKQLGDARPVQSLVKNMGLSEQRVPAVPSICLGSCDLTVFEMTGAYTTFANNGRYNKPIFITRIEDRNGRPIYQEVPEERVALHPNANFVILEMLRNVMRQGIPGFSKIKSEVAGKTGTTNDYVDGWFMGVTPDLVVGTWVGGDDRWIRFLSLRDGIGAKMARPFYAKLLNRLEQDSTADYNKDHRFFRPPGDLGIVINCDEYQQEGRIQNFDTEDGTIREDESFGDDFFGDELERRPLRDSTSEENEEF